MQNVKRLHRLLKASLHVCFTYDVHGGQHHYKWESRREIGLLLLPTMRRAGHAPNLGNMLERWRANQVALLGKDATG